MQVLIAKTLFSSESLHLVSALFHTMYGKSPELQLYQVDDNIKEYLVVNVDESRGKQVAVNYVKNLGFSHCFFIKNNVLFKKYSDTGIVDKLGYIEKVDNVFKLKGL